jgi:diguanylate cyclase (GGDEF)-like protein/PAS domain S-box-containing protein
VSPSPSPAPLILVAEDSALGTAVMRDDLEGHGHRVLTAPDGARAMEVIRARPDLDLVITDGDMPVLDGLAVCRAVQLERPSLPVIYVTADERRVVEALDAGADDFLPKPVESHELRARVHAALRTGRLRAALAAERDLSRAVVTSIQDGLAVFSASGRILMVNERLTEITGFSAAELEDREPPFPFWPAETADLYAERFRAGLAGGSVWEGDRTYVRRDGARRTVIASLAPLPTASGDGPAFVSTVKDVSARRAAEDELRRSEVAQRALAREQAALGRVAAAVAKGTPRAEVFDLVARVVAELLGADAGGVARFDGGGAVLVGSWSCDDSLRRPVGTRLSLEGDSATGRVRDGGVPVRIDHGAPAGRDERGGGHVPRRSSIAAPIWVGGAVWGAVGALSLREDALAPGAEMRLGDFAILVAAAIAAADAQEELARLATTDPLTGLANRRAFEARLAEEIARARDGRPLSLVALDLDHFKDVNDTFGHDVGDAVLRELAVRMRAAARAADVVARVGGEEFAWLLPGCTARQAHAAAERLRAAVETTPFGVAGVRTLSAGVAQLAGGDDRGGLVRRADALLYVAKRDGRNRVMEQDPALVA